MKEKIEKTEEEWKKLLTPEQYRVMRKRGTEPAFSCAWKKPENGIYSCAACNLPQNLESLGKNMANITANKEFIP